MNQLSIKQKANAKINLYLHVTGKRDDGYHTLDSLVVFADIGDKISVTPNGESGEISLVATGPFAKDIPLDENNLVIRAAKLLQQMYATNLGANILLEKNLPPASGIGGGSADAAATIRALAELWKIDLSKKDQTEFNKTLALNLGADVPVCMENKNVFMSGIGEILTTAPTLPPFWLVLVNSGSRVFTPDVFSGRKGDFSQTGKFDEQPANVDELVTILSKRSNDLFTSALDLAPEIQNVIGALQQQDGALLVRMSGSGATCFAIFANKRAAHGAAAKIAEKYPEWWVGAARMALS